MTHDDFVLIGVDGGATEVKAHAVARVTSDTNPTYALRSETASRRYPRTGGFHPVPTQQQLEQHADARVELTTAEREQGSAWVMATADVITEVASAAGASTALVGIGMPGLKTADGRGINVMNNGPRIPNFQNQLTVALEERGLRLAAPFPALQSDADCCGLGEEHAADGLFRGVVNAYYIGGGTGIADALKLDDQLVPFDRASGWIQKAWQMHSALGPTFEQLISARALNDVYAKLTHSDAGDFPEEAAATGDTLAITWLSAAALVLAELIHERLVTIKRGRAATAYLGSTYTELEAEHPFIGTVLERVVVGQRLGLIYGDRRYRDVFAAKVDRHVAALLVASGDEELCRACLCEAPVSDRPPALRADFIIGSRLRAAPALGAAIVAAQSCADELD